MHIFRRREQPPSGRPPDTGDAAAFLLRGTQVYLTLLLVTLFIGLPYSLWWLYTSGDLAVERVVERQARGESAVFGSGVSQDFVDYKLQLYARTEPAIVALGSSRVMQFRGRVFEKPFLNMGGTAGNLPVLRSTLDAMLAVHRPEAVILGLDFWWFMPTWNADPFQEEPPTQGSYALSLSALQKPWAWLLSGKISPREFLAPFATLVGLGFRENRYGIMAQQTDDGFGSDGSWYNVAESTGQKKPFDFQFRDTLSQIRSGIKAFYQIHDPLAFPSERHLDAFAEIYCRLQSRGIRTYVFLPPVAGRVYSSLKERESLYPHLFLLAQALRARGINVLDLSDPRKTGSSDCEFIDGFHGGEITYLRILRSLCDQWSSLVSYVNMNTVNQLIRDWRDHVLVFDDTISSYREVDFMELGCRKHGPIGMPQQ